MTDFKKAICEALSHDVLHDSDTQLAIHSKDSSIFTKEPEGVLYPKTVADIKTIVKLATKHGVGLSVRAGGTCMSGGSLTEGYVLNLTKYMTSIQVNPYAKSAEIEMGAYYRDLEKEILKYNLMFPAYTSSKDICGIGGMLGNNASGEKSIRYGGTLDNVHAVHVVLHDGEEYVFEEVSDDEFKKHMKQGGVYGTVCKKLHEIYTTYHGEYTKAVGSVKKSASGYRLEKIYNPKTKTWNLAKLFIGAQATLGIITKARLRLVPINPYKRALIVSVHSLAELPELLQTIMKYNPESVETFDKNTYHFAKKFLPKETLTIQHFFGPDVELIVIAEFSENTQKETDATAHMVSKTLKELGAKVEYITDTKIIDAAWAVRRSSFRVLRDATFSNTNKRAVPCIEDIIVPIQNFDVFIPELLGILKKYNIEYGFHGHIGDGALRVVPVFDFTHKDIALAHIQEFMEDVFSLIKKVHGNISADHSDGLIRTPFLEMFYGTKLYTEVIVAIKKLFDPYTIFNPHKKIGLTTKQWTDWVR